MGPLAFVVYCALARHCNTEGSCFPSIATLGSECGMSRSSVIRAIQKLVSMGYITQLFEGGPGKGASRYFIMSLSVRVPSVPQTLGLVSTGHQPSVSQTPALVSVGHPKNTNEKNTNLRTQYNTSSASPKVCDSPLQSAVSKIPVPESLQTSAFLAAWTDWQTYRRQRKQTLTEIGAKRVLKEFEKWGPDNAVLAIERSITNGWQGVFDPTERQQINGKPNRASQQRADKAGREFPEHIRFG